MTWYDRKGDSACLWRIDNGGGETIGDAKRATMKKSNTELSHWEFVPTLAGYRSEHESSKKSGSGWCLVWASTVGLPSERAEIGYWS